MALKATVGGLSSVLPASCHTFRAPLEVRGANLVKATKHADLVPFLGKLNITRIVFLGAQFLSHHSSWNSCAASVKTFICFWQNMSLEAMDGMQKLCTIAIRDTTLSNVLLRPVGQLQL